jgi:hypothetical protein
MSSIMETEGSFPRKEFDALSNEAKSLHLNCHPNTDECKEMAPNFVSTWNMSGLLNAISTTTLTIESH